MRIGVTGATGFVGRALISRLQQSGHEVVPIVRRAAGQPDEVVVGDLSASPTWPAALSLDVVVHLAARAHVMRETEADADAAYHNVNVEGTRGALSLAQAAKACRFILVSSIKANGETTCPGNPFRPDSEPHPLDSYGRSKLAAEAVVKDVSDAAGMDWMIIRPPMIYGPGAKGNFPMLARLVRSGIPLPFASIKNKRSMIYIGNLVDLLERCAVHGGASGSVILPSDGVDQSVPDLIRAIAVAAEVRPRLFPFPVSFLHLAGRLTGRGDQMARLTGSLQVDASSAAKQLDWTPPFRVEDAIRITVRNDQPTGSF